MGSGRHESRNSKITEFHCRAAWLTLVGPSNICTHWTGLPASTFAPRQFSQQAELLQSLSRQVGALSRASHKSSLPHLERDCRIMATRGARLAGAEGIIISLQCTKVCKEGKLPKRTLLCNACLSGSDNTTDHSRQALVILVCRPCASCRWSAAASLCKCPARRVFSAGWMGKPGGSE